MGTELQMNDELNQFLTAFDAGDEETLMKMFCTLLCLQGLLEIGLLHIT